MEITQSIIEEAKAIINSDDFKKQVNTRKYEIDITLIAKKYIITEQLYDSLLEEIEKCYRNNIELSFTLFFILFTMCRRQNYKDYLELADSYDEKYEEYEIMKHIKLMAILNKSSHPNVIYKAIKESSKLVELKNEYCDFSCHVGALNVYTELICKYFEYHLDERQESQNQELLKQARDCIKNVIELEKKEKGSYETVYEKFYLNYGRVLILLGNYAKGEEQILKAINLLPESADRNAKINEYNQYLLKASITHAYDLNEEKVKDLEKVKVSNYKSIALMTTLLGFLLGVINIFTTISDPFTLAMLMLCYLGLLFVLMGVVLCGLSLTLREKKVKLLVYDILIVVIGIIIFTITMIIILK